MGNTYQPVTLQINSPLVHVEGGLDASMMGEMTRLMENRVPKIIEHSMINVMKTKGLK